MVRYGDGGVLSLNYNGRIHEMRPAPATSGSRWLGETLEWRILLEDSGEVGTLSRTTAPPGDDAVIARCVRAPVGAPLAPEPGAVTRASNACRADVLSLEVTGHDAGAGNRFTTLAFRNDGTTACTLQGYPGLALVGANGQPRAPFRFEQAPEPYYTPTQTPAVVTLEPGGRAWFDLRTTAVAGEVAGETEPCPAVTAIRAEPPGEAGAVQAAVQLNPCNQRARVSPFRPTEDSSPPA